MEEYKFTSQEQDKMFYLAEMLIVNSHSFRYDANEKSVIAELDENEMELYKGFTCTDCTPTQPSQAEVDELNEELYNLLEENTEDGYLSLSESVYATAEQETYPDYLTRITEIDVDAVQIDGSEIVFIGSEYIGAGDFRKADQKRVYEQALKDLKEDNNGK